MGLIPSYQYDWLIKCLYFIACSEKKKQIRFCQIYRIRVSSMMIEEFSHERMSFIHFILHMKKLSDRVVSQMHHVIQPIIKESLMLMDMIPSITVFHFSPTLIYLHECLFTEASFHLLNRFSPSLFYRAVALESAQYLLNLISLTNSLPSK